MIGTNRSEKKVKCEKCAHCIVLQLQTILQERQYGERLPNEYLNYISPLDLAFMSIWTYYPPTICASELIMKQGVCKFS